MQAPPQQPLPGWHPDPWNPNGLRWWDGTQWTPHASGPPAPDHSGIEYLIPVNTDGWAIASGYLGLLSLIPNPFTSVLALVFCVLALRSVKKAGKHGKGRAIVGLVLGGVSLALFAFLMVVASISSSS